MFVFLTVFSVQLDEIRTLRDDPIHLEAQSTDIGIVRTERVRFWGTRNRIAFAVGADQQVILKILAMTAPPCVIIKILDCRIGQVVLGHIYHEVLPDVIKSADPRQPPHLFLKLSSVRLGIMRFVFVK